MGGNQEGAKKRHETMVNKYGSEEALAEKYREWKRKSMEHPNNRKGTHRGGFNNPETLKKAQESRASARKNR